MCHLKSRSEKRLAPSVEEAQSLLPISFKGNQCDQMSDRGGARQRAGRPRGSANRKIDAAIGRKLGDNIVLTLEGSVPVIKDYPVYDYMVELRVSARF
jgi:hypothetical protein